VKAQILILILLCAPMMSCSQIGQQLGIEHQAYTIVMPNDESTAYERRVIKRTTKKIEAIAYNLGKEETFESIPVLVTTEDPSVTKRWGYCQWDENGKGVFIVLNREVFQKDLENDRLHFVFGVLLHEIGHCYFGRKHDTAVIKKPGYKISIETFDADGGTTITIDEFPVSIMYSKSSLVGSPLTGVPTSLEHYFVAEILGLQRVSSVEDLEQLPGVYFTSIDE
jgi:hypothetical protein